MIKNGLNKIILLCVLIISIQSKAEIHYENEVCRYQADDLVDSVCQSYLTEEGYYDPLHSTNHKIIAAETRIHLNCGVTIQFINPDLINISEITSESFLKSLPKSYGVFYNLQSDNSKSNWLSIDELAYINDQIYNELVLEMPKCLAQVILRSNDENSIRIRHLLGVILGFKETAAALQLDPKERISAK